MARIIENMEGKRKLIKLSSADVISVVREYQSITYGCKTNEEVRSRLSDNVFFVLEDI